MASEIEKLKTELAQTRAALAIACERIADGPQTYEEAKTGPDWAREFLRQARAAR